MSDSRDSAKTASAPTAGEILSVREKVGYALGDAAFVLFWHTWSQFLLIFYTDVFLVSASAVGVMFGVTRLFDAINDPVMGVVADRTRSRHGSFRPWLLWGVVPFMALGVLLFTTPDLSPNGKLVYAYATYVGASMVYTMLNIPYGALMGVMTSRASERTVLATFRFYGAYAAVFFVNLTLLRMVATLGRGDDAVGYQRTMIVYALLAGAFVRQDDAHAAVDAAQRQ